MKHRVVITRQVGRCTVDLLRILSEVTIKSSPEPLSPAALAVLASEATALMVSAGDRVDEQLLDKCRRLQVVACSFATPARIDVAACTKRGVWVTTAGVGMPVPDLHLEWELDAARNILDVFNGDVPRGAINRVRATALA